MKVKVKKVQPDAILPTYATNGSGCFDLYSCRECSIVDSADPVVFQTGLQFEIPEGYVMLVFSRSGHGFKSGVRLANCVGVIDSDYRGEVMVKLTCDEATEWLAINKSDRIAQAMIIPYEQVYFEEAFELSSTERGTGGFGSSGK